MERIEYLAGNRDKLDTKTSHKLSEIKDQYFLMSFKKKNPFTIIQYDGSILQEIAFSFFSFMMVFLVWQLVFISETHKKHIVYKLADKLREITDTVLDVTVVIPFSMGISAILQNLKETSQNSVVHLDFYIFKIGEIFVNKSLEKKKLKELNENINKMVCETFKFMDDNVNLGDIKDLSDNLLYSKEELKNCAEQIKYRVRDEFTHAIRIFKLLEDLDGKEEVVEVMNRVVEKLLDLKRYRDRMLPYVYVSTLFVLSNLYILRIYLDFLFGKLAFMTFMTNFIIFYGLPKVAAAYYYPFGRNHGKIDLAQVAKQNYFISSTIIEKLYSS